MSPQPLFVLFRHGLFGLQGEGFPRTIGLLELKAECQVAKPTSGPETPADGAPYVFFVTGGAFEPVVDRSAA